MSERVFIGIDPGLSGAVAVIDGDSIELFDVPTRKATRGEEWLDGEMADLLRPYAGRSFAVLEEAGVPRFRPSQRRSVDDDFAGAGTARTALKIGRGWGLWKGILSALGIAHEIVAPAAWKKALGVPTGSDKKISRQKAQELVPAIRAELARRRPDFSEALLLAEWGRRRRG